MPGIMLYLLKGIIYGGDSFDYYCNKAQEHG